MNTICRELSILLLVGSICVFAGAPDKNVEKVRGLLVNAFELANQADQKLDRLEHSKKDNEAQEADYQKIEDLYYKALKRYLIIDRLDANYFVDIISYRIAHCNDKILMLRKKRESDTSHEPVDEIMNELQGRKTLEEMEELLKARNTELNEVKKELEDTTKKLEQEIQKNTLPNP